MPRPDVNSIVIELPSIDTPMAGAENQACGQSWEFDAPISQPYQGVTKYSAHLSPITQLEEGYLQTTSTLDDVGQAIALTVNTMSGTNDAVPVKFVTAQRSAGGGFETRAGGTPPPPPSGELTLPLEIDDVANSAAIENLIARSAYYGALAKELWDYWATEYKPAPTSDTHSTWPLFEGVYDVYPYCQGLAPGAVIPADSTAGRWFDQLCPTEDALVQHEEDGEKFSRLVSAAIHWARCAQEAMYVVGLHHLNKAEFERLNPAGGATTPGPTILEPGVLPGPGDNGDAGDGDGGAVTETPETSPAPTGFSAMKTWKKVALLGGVAFLGYKILKK